MTLPIDTEHFRALFDPRGVVVAGASAHPGKFGFVALHNILSCGFAGAVFATNLEGGSVLGIETVRSIADIPDGVADLVVVCTPAAANLELLKGCAARGIRAAFVTSAGYADAGPDGVRAQEELVAVAAELGILVAGPNGQGLVSTPSSLCAQMVGPYPSRGKIGLASQSGNLVSAFMNLATQTGVGVSRAVSAGNAAMTSVADFLEFYGSDPETAVGLAYVEGVADGRAFFDRMQRVAREIAARDRQGGSDRRWPARRCLPHGRPCDRRSSLRRRVPPGWCHPRRIVRGSV